ncbi:MAG: CHAT domain-containing protein [Acidobacteria bacterium]|nr:CHAT domain-containing protein [Acidobacteriota bacterium]
MPASTQAVAAPVTQSAIEGQVREGRDLWARGALGPAMAALEKALSQPELESNPLAEARCRNLIGNVADSQGEFDRGAQEHSRALRLAQRAGDRRLEAEILADTGLGLWRRAEYPRALAVLDRALALQEELGLKLDGARTMVLIGRVHFKEGDYQPALGFHSRALAIQEAAGDHAGAAVTLEDIGDVHLELRSHARAIEDFKGSLALRESLGDIAGQNWILTVLGTAYLVQGSFADAEHNYLRALAVAEAADDHAGRARALYHLGLAHVQTGEYQRAATSLATAARLHEALGDRRAMAWDLEYLGLARRRAGDHAGAVLEYTQALAIRDAIRDLRGLASTLDALGVAQEGMGDLTAALATYRRAFSLGEELHLPYVCLMLGRIGHVLAAMGRSGEALEHARRAVERARLVDNRGLLWPALHQLAGTERQLGHPEAALKALAESMAVIEAIRSDVAQGESGAGFLDDKQAVFTDAIELLFAGGREGEALEVAERARARAFIDLLATGRAGEATKEPTSGGRPSAATRGAVRTTLTHGGEPESTVRGGAAPVSRGWIQAEARRRRATMVEYFVGSEAVFAWVVSPDGVVIGKAVRSPRRDLEALIEAVRRESGLPAPAGSPAAGDPWRRLHRLIIEPLMPSLPADPTALVLLAPHGPLWAVPFAGLRDAAGRTLVERHTLVLVPALGALSAPPRGGNGPHGALVVGNPSMPSLPELGPLPPLPAAGREAVAVATVLGEGRVTLLTGERATEEEVRWLAPRRALLHFATHGVVRDDSPLDSLLVLGGGGRADDGDGRWTAREILDLHLDAELVVLSGCDTGRGRITADGVLGLGRAFLAAGARAVLVSLARVEDDATEALMVRFYRELVRNGGRQAEALRHAQLAAIAEPPAHWAPFALIGEPH